MVTGQTWTCDFRQKNHPFFVNEKKSFEWKKNLRSGIVLLYISKKPVKFKVNRLSDFRVIAVTDLKNVVSKKKHLKF